MRHILAILTIAAIPRLINLGSEKFWYDETFTAWTSQPTTDFWQAVKSDNHPPLWPLLQALNVRVFGNGEFTFRLPAAISSLGIVLLLFLIARKLFDDKAALITAITAAVSPGLIYFAQDARMYSLLTFAVLLALYSAIRGNWIMLAIGGVAAVYTHNIGLVYIGCIWVALLLTRQIKGVIVLCGVGLLWLPWALTMFGQMRAVGASFWLQDKLDLPTLIQPWLMNTLGFRAPQLLNGIFGIVGAGATITALYMLRKWFLTRQGLLVSATAIGAPIAIALISISWRNIFVFRGLMPATTLSFLAWGFMLRNLSPFNRKIAIAALAPVFALGLLAHWFPTQTSARHDLTAFVAPIRANYRQGDVIFHIVPNSMVDYGFYMRDLNQVVWQSPGDIVSVTDGCQSAFGWTRTTVDALASQGATKRIWVIWGGNPFTRSDRLAELTRILALYHPAMVARFATSEWMEDSIYLVEL